jgi:hypothetical protein
LQFLGVEKRFHTAWTHSARSLLVRHSALTLIDFTKALSGLPTPPSDIVSLARTLDALCHWEIETEGG